MLTLLFLHAHPDDESILTGETMVKAHRQGHRVLAAFATRGDAGETAQDLGGQTLGERREQEVRLACEALGVDRVLFLEYDDSGMADTETTKNPKAFCNANLEEVTARLAIALVNERVDIVVGYDRNGTYGHPDHIQIHHAAHHAAPALRASWVLDATYSREFLASLDDSGYGEVDENFASPHDELTHFVEGADLFAAKLEALKFHTSQTPDDWNPDDPEQVVGFAKQFGTEWYIATPVPGDTGDTGNNGDNEPPPLEPLFTPKDEWSGAPPPFTPTQTK